MSDFFVHPQALCESTQIGTGTRIWAFAHVLRGATVGRDCNICDHTFVENDVVIGDRVTVKCGVHIWDGVRVEDDVFIGPNVAFTNDSFPRSRIPGRPTQTRVCRGASLGANATLLPGLTVGPNAMVGAGSVLTSDVPPNAIVVGNPARIVGYVDSDPPTAAWPQLAPREQALDVEPTRVRGVSRHRMRIVQDLRGSLSAGEFQKEIPFAVQRYFLVFDVPSEEVRGAHAHRVCHQFLVCIKGACSVLVDDGAEREEIRLGSPADGVHLPPMVWATLHKYSADAILLVLASHYYDPADYIREYDEFLRVMRAAE